MGKETTDKKLEKEKQEKTLKVIKLVAFFLVVAFVVALGIFSIFVKPETWVYYFNQPKIEKRKEGEMRVHFLDVGQADCTLIEFPDGKRMLIDGGDVDADEKILRYLNALKIEKLDYLLLTHSDSDHCGALNVVIREKEVGKVILPLLEGDEEVGNSAFALFSEELSKSDTQTEIASRYWSVKSSDVRYPYNFTILYPHTEMNTNIYDANELSTVCWLDYKGTSVLLCGDTNKEVLNHIAREDELGVFTSVGVYLRSTEIIKLPHHGASDGLSKVLLNYFNADTGILSCGKNNFYGHPAASTLEILNETNVKLYRTDWQGDITLSVGVDGAREITTENK